MGLVNSTVQQWLDEARSDPDAFWAKAAEHCHWFEPWTQTFDWTPPTYRWFAGGMTNISYNALDLHVEQGRGDATALIALNERGAHHSFTYAELLEGVKDVARALRGLGVERGDRVGIYMPTVA